MNHQRRPAFTVLELLVVMFIVGLMISILIPSFSRAREAARRTVCVSRLKHLGASTFTYAFDANDFGPQVMKRAGTKAPRSLISRSGKYVNLGLLYSTELLNDSRIFFCPSQQRFSYASDPAYLPAATVSGSYAYAVHIPSEDSPMLSRLRHLALITDDFTARLGAPAGVGRYSHKVGYNVLYTDGSASWYSDPDMKIANRAVHWDNETDDINYDTLYQSDADIADGSYGNDLDVFRVWWAFCYNKPVRFSD